MGVVMIKPEWWIFAGVLFFILGISLASRARVFCQYLRVMTGIALTPKEVKTVFRARGKAGVRELFLDLLIREDLADTPAITPDTPPSKPVTDLIDR